MAFNQGQVHSILRAVSSETLISLVHLMKNMLEEAMKVGARTQSSSQGTSRPKIKCFRKQSDGSDASGLDSDPGTEGYTSGALSSDDEFVVNSQKRTREIVITRPPVHPATSQPRPQFRLPVIRSPVEDTALQTMNPCQIWL